MVAVAHYRRHLSQRVSHLVIEGFIDTSRDMVFTSQVGHHFTSPKYLKRRSASVKMSATERDGHVFNQLAGDASP